MKTTWKKTKDIERKWYIVDADGIVLGRLASRIATLLIGKGKVDNVPNLDCGDHVVVINAEKIRVTGNKLTSKKYRRHSGYAGGFKELTLEQVLATQPEKVVRTAVKNMLPKTKLRDPMMARLVVYAGSEHPHEAQKPVEIKLTSNK